MNEEALNRIKELESKLDRAENPVKVITMYPLARAVEEPSHEEKERLIKEYLKAANQ
jgi:hypothetical protein